MKSDIPVESYALEFETELPVLRERAQEIERAVLAGICRLLAEKKSSDEEFGVAEFWLDRNDCPRFNIRLPLDFERAGATYRLDDFAETVRSLLREFANDFYNGICEPATSMEGPDAASFARQMRRPDVAAFIEAKLIEKEACVGGAHRVRPGL